MNVQDKFTAKDTLCKRVLSSTVSFDWEGEGESVNFQRDGQQNGADRCFLKALGMRNR